MSEKHGKTLALAIGATFLTAAGAAFASPQFALLDLAGGYMIAAGSIEKVDTNKDGKVSRAEHAAHADAMFTDADANKDGFVDQAEMEKAHHEGKCGEGKCGEGKCGQSKGKEGHCGHDHEHDKGKDGSCGGAA